MPTILKVICMNVNGPDVGENRPERRRQAIYNTVTNLYPHIVLFQEFEWVDIRNRNWGVNALPNEYHRFRHKDTSIMVNRLIFPLDTSRDIPALVLQNAQPQNPGPMMHIEAARYAIKILRFQGDSKLICISWHGPHRGYTNQAKVSYFQHLMLFIQNIRNRYDLPMIVGGDFNVERNLVEHLVTEPFTMVQYDASARRRIVGVIDYCLVTDAFNIKKAVWLDLNTPFTTGNPFTILNHDPIEITTLVLPSDEYLRDIRRLFAAG